VVHLQASKVARRTIIDAIFSGTQSAFGFNVPTLISQFVRQSKNCVPRQQLRGLRRRVAGWPASFESCHCGAFHPVGRFRPRWETDSPVGVPLVARMWTE
jgi:hypothetical protein